jgi:hypothetical protein
VSAGMGLVGDHRRAQRVGVAFPEVGSGVLV